MTVYNLQGKKIAILATDGFEQAELLKPREALETAGAKTYVVAPDKTQKSGEIKGWDKKDWGATVHVDMSISQVRAADFDALVLPGGVMNPDKLRTDKPSVAFVKEFFTSRKPIGAICHGPWTLIEANVVDGRTLTSWPSLQTDLRNAGATWIDQEVVADHQLVTSRNPGDIPAFCNKLIEVIGRGAARQLRRVS